MNARFGSRLIYINIFCNPVFYCLFLVAQLIDRNLGQLVSLFSNCDWLKRSWLFLMACTGVKISCPFMRLCGLYTMACNISSWVLMFSISFSFRWIGALHCRSKWYVGWQHIGDIGFRIFWLKSFFLRNLPRFSISYCVFLSWSFLKI